MGSDDLLEWLAGLPPAARDGAVEERLGIGLPSASPAPPGEHMTGYHASGVAPIVHSILEVPILAEDVVVDLGAGLGKVVMLVRMLAGARARGIELQPGLVDHARCAAARLGVDVGFVAADARQAELDDGTVFFLYAPFTGPVLAHVLRRLEDVARRRAITVCALGVDLDRMAPWLAPRPVDSFWLTIYDSVKPGVLPRRRARPTWGPAAEAVAFERGRLRPDTLSAGAPAG